MSVCREYAGPDYSVKVDNVLPGVGLCAEKNGVYSEVACYDRDDLNSPTHNFDGYRGRCVLKCGEENEERMYIYNDTIDPMSGNVIEPDSMCPAPDNMWYPAK